MHTQVVLFAANPHKKMLLSGNRETEEQNSNGCKLLVKKDAMLDSLDARERSYDNSANGINFTIRKVNLMFVFIVVVWIFSFNKYVIQGSVFFCV